MKVSLTPPIVSVTSTAVRYTVDDAADMMVSPATTVVAVEV